MKPKRKRSISYLMDRCKSREQQLLLAQTWRQTWQNRHIEIIDALKHAIDEGDDDNMRMLFAELRTLTEHSHSALERILVRLATPFGEGKDA